MGSSEHQSSAAQQLAGGSLKVEGPPSGQPVQLLDHLSLMVLGLPENKIEFLEPGAKDAFAGQIDLLGRVLGGVRVDPRFFGIGRTASYANYSQITGLVSLLVPPGMPQSALRRGKVTVVQNESLGGSFTLNDGAQGHGSLVVIQHAAIEGVDIEITTRGETAAYATRIEIFGASVNDLKITGLPSEVRLEAGVLKVLVSADLDPLIAQQVMNERIAEMTNRPELRHPWNR